MMLLVWKLPPRERAFVLAVNRKPQMDPIQKPGGVQEVPRSDSDQTVTILSAQDHPKVDWKQILVQIEPFLLELPDPEFPPEIANDPNERLQWFQKWQQTEPGKLWCSMKLALEVHRESKPEFQATLNDDGEFRFDDIPEGEYVIKHSFTQRRYRFSVPHMADGKSDQPLDLGQLTLDQ